MILRISFVVIVLLLCTSCCNAEDDVESDSEVSAVDETSIVIGAIFYDDSDGKLKQTFDDECNSTPSGSDRKTLKGSRKTVRRDNIIDVESAVCALAKEGVVAIVDGTSGKTSAHIQAICDSLEIPHVIVTESTELISNDWSAISMFPSPSVYSDILIELVNVKDWQNFTILYVKGHSLSRTEALLKINNYTFNILELSGDTYRKVLVNARESGATNFIVDCPSSLLERILREAQQVGLLADEHSYIFLSPDLHIIDIEPFRWGGVNITGFSLMTSDDEALKEYFKENEVDYPPRTDIALMRDAVKLIAQTVNTLNISVKSLDCSAENWMTDGSSVLNELKTTKFSGLTGNIKFDSSGQRVNFVYHIFELATSGFVRIGAWNSDTLEIARPFAMAPDLDPADLIKNKTLKVLISLIAPYGYRKENTDSLSGNDQYEGFTVDLINRIAENLQFFVKYEVEAETDVMIENLIGDKADMAISDLTITSERLKLIDFTTPFMTLGISILFKKPSKQPPKVFAFLAVFEADVWVYMLLVQIGVGIVMVFVGRISQKEWQNPVPCIEQPEELVNQFRFSNALWLIIGSVMQQGSEIAPIALAPRMITSIMWFFTMVMISSYTGTLSTFLTVESKTLPFSSVDELIKSNIPYGAKRGGSTLTFFKNSMEDKYRKMYQKMEKGDGLLVGTTEKGVEKVEKETYAFFMESTSIEYYTERHCDLMQVGDKLDSKNYAIGLVKGSKYTYFLDKEIIRLKELGEIDAMKRKWWNERRGGGSCMEEADMTPTTLYIKNTIGAFVVLGGGCIVGLIISTLDMLWNVFKRSVKYQTTFKYELIEELKFVIKFSGDVKKVKRDRPGAESDSLGKSISEARDELGSLRSNASVDTHRTRHSHSSQHSSRSQSVAIARMRRYS